jgi:hypothetical protein
VPPKIAKGEEARFAGLLQERLCHITARADAAFGHETL